MSDSVLSRRSAHGLLWKEGRQLVPLMVASLCLSLPVAVIILLFPESWGFADEAYMVPMGIPAIFAVGAGAVLIGQEKEKRTIEWLSSMPIAAAELVKTKLFVAVMGLLVMGLCGVILSTGLAYFTDVNPLAANEMAAGGGFTFWDLVGWALHLVYVTLCGLFAAWYFRSSFVSLLAILPLGVAPFVLTQLGYSIRQASMGYRYISPVASSLVGISVALVSVAIMTYLTYRVGVKNLGPAKAPRLLSPKINAAADIAMGSATSRSIPDVPFRYSVSSLVWQSINHSRLALAVVTGMMLVGTVGFVVAHHLDAFGDYGNVGMLLGFLGTSLLGVFAFTGDGSQARLRFLAERGLSPSKVWLGRHLAAISILCVALLIYAGLSLWLLTVRDQGFLRNTRVLSVSMIGLSIWTIYNLSQWVSQLIPATAIAVIVAPCLSLVTFPWLYFLIELGVPTWLAFLFCSAPMAVTWMSMRRHMDGRGRVMQATLSVVALCFLFVLPVAYRLQAVYGHLIAHQVDFEHLSARNAHTELYLEATRIGKQARKPVLVSIRPTTWSDDINESEYGFEKDVANEIELTSEEALSRIGICLARRPGEMLGPYLSDEKTHDSSIAQPVRMRRHTLYPLLDHAAYVRLAFLDQPKQQSQIDLLEEQVTLFTQLTKQLRLSPNWRDQDIADTLEIWLLQTLVSDQSKPLLERPAFRVAVELIGDQPSRNRARRRATMASWYLMTQPNNHEYTGGSIDGMLDLIDAAEQGRDVTPILRRIHRSAVPSEIAFQDGAYSDRVRVGANDPYVTLDVSNELLLPASQWYADWEKDAVRLWQSQKNVPAEDSK